MTEAQDFSAITFVGKDLSFEQIKIVSLNQIRSKLMSWQIILFFLAGPIIIGIGNLVLGQYLANIYHLKFKCVLS